MINILNSNTRDEGAMLYPTVCRATFFNVLILIVPRLWHTWTRTVWSTYRAPIFRN